MGERNGERLFAHPTRWPKHSRVSEPRGGDDSDGRRRLGTCLRYGDLNSSGALGNDERNLDVQAPGALISLGGEGFVADGLIGSTARLGFQQSLGCKRYQSSTRL